MKKIFAFILILFQCISTALCDTFDDDIMAYIRASKMNQATADVVSRFCNNFGPGGDMSIVFACAQQLSNQGYSIGDWLLGWCYEAGEGCKFDPQKAFECHKKAATARVPFAWAYRALADCYIFGVGTERDIKQAKYWYERACEEIKYIDNKAHSYLQLGVIYRCGDEGVPADLALCRSYYEKAANLGNATAAANLAGLYANGRGVEIDPQKIYYWALKAAELGDTNCQCIMGKAYVSGESSFGNVPIDKEKGITLLKKAAENGNVDAMKFLNKMGL